MDGILNIDKEAGLTSHQVVAGVRKILPGLKVGHAGTLDPAATGVLPVCLGKATRIAEYLMEHSKGYLAGVTLGVTTDTEDAEGEVLTRSPVPVLQRADLEKLFQSLTGILEQVPPAYSAVKHKGKPLYYWARRGEEVLLPARRVFIYNLELLEYSAAGNPHLLFKVECSRGTYIRTLAAEIGRRIGCGAHLMTLRRLFVGPFAVEQAHKLEEIDTRDRCESFLIPMDRALQQYPAASVTPEAVRALEQGRFVRIDQVELWPREAAAGDRPMRVYDWEGEFVALAGWLLADDSLKLKTVKFLAG